MTPVIPCSVSNISFIPVNAFTTRKNRCFTRYNSSGNPTKQSLSYQRLFVTLPRTSTIFPQLSNGCASHKTSTKVSATGTDVVIEEQESSIGDDSSAGPSEEVVTKEETPTTSDVSAAPARAKRRQGRKSEMPPVKNENLIPGAVFTGKIRSIQPFGAFVDFGAFTDGLVHVSRLSDSFVKDVNDVVSLGQEVKVRLVEVNTETGRISLSMRDEDDTSKPQQKKNTDSDKGRPPRKNAKREEARKTSKFVKGQDLVGTVKNFARAGAFVSLPEGEEGFLPTSEEPDDGFGNVMGNTSLEVGQEVNVRVLRIARGIVTLTMKKDDDVQKLDSKLNQGVVHTATNPFVVAFRRNKDIAAFLDERDKLEEPVEVSSQTDSTEDLTEALGQTELSEPSEPQSDHKTVDESSEGVSDAVDGSIEEVEGFSTENILETTVDIDASVETSNKDDSKESSADDISQSLDGEATMPGLEAEVKQEVPSVETSSKDDSEESSAADISQTLDGEATMPDLEAEIKQEVPSVETSSGDDSEETSAADISQSLDGEATMPGLEAEIKQEIPDSELAPVVEDSNKEISDPSGDVDTADVAATISQADTPVVKDGDETPISVAPPSDETQTEEVSIKQEVSASQVQSETLTSENSDGVAETNGSSPQSSASKAISPALVKQLRDETGAGMMDCKKALAETGGDIVKAQEYLRKKGLASADKKASRTTAEGRIGSYIHDSRIGVLIEVNCETDFVSRGDIFRELVDDLAMQVAACPQVKYLSTEDVPKEIVDKEKEIEMQKEDLLSKPEQIRSKIVEGRVSKRLGDLALLEQPYIKDDKVAVKDWVKQTIATIGENIKVKRFVKYNLGEGLEKKNQNFAAEVAAQTAAKPVPTPEQEKSTTVVVEAPVEKAPSVAVSAALVKQLREETGAGMMDCKKALSETGGDLEKAQEYLRKKGLSSADKKSSRIAAEGRIGSYIHDARIGVLIEVNCETDFVARSENFKELVDDLAMQVAACPLVQYVSIEDIPESIVSKEKAIEMQREDILSKPENIREKIVEGRISKRLGELALLEQPFIKNDSILVKDLVKQTVAALGENIKVRRFARFTLGEETESTNVESEA